MGNRRVVHFVTGGGSGATRVAVDIATGHVASGSGIEPFVIFRRKKQPLREDFTRDLTAAGVRWAEVPRAPKWKTVRETEKVLREFSPGAIFAHGFSDHLWARRAAVRADVPLIYQVEHNIERTNFFERWLSRRLAPRTTQIVAVSGGVAASLVKQGLQREKIRVIHNGVRLDRFAAMQPAPLAAREPAVLMAARFGRQKDHATFLRAVAILRDRGEPIRLKLAGSGSSRHLRRAESLARRLNLGDTCEFLGQRSDVPELLASHQVFVLSSHFEGLPLALAEAMAAGCAVVASRVSGCEDLIDSGRTGLLVPHEDPVALANALACLLADPAAAQPMADAGRALALANFGTKRMVADYEALLKEGWTSTGAGA